MTLKKELQDIVDDLEFDSDEEKVAFEKVLAGKAGTKIQASYMKAADYTTKTQALADAKRALEAEQAKWNDEQDSYVGTLSSYKEDMETRLNAALKQASESRLYGAALESKLETIAAQYGEDPSELLKDVKQLRNEPVKKDEPKEIDPRYITTDKFDQAANAVFGFAPALRDIEREYKRLYGKEFEGSMQELVNEGTKQVNSRRQRGDNIDLFGYMREKLDFNGQKTRNDEAAKLAAEAERKKWEDDTRAEIEKNVHSSYLAANPGAMRKQDQANDWRQNLSAEKRTEVKERRPTAVDTFKRQQDIHKAYEERQAKSESAA